MSISDEEIKDLKIGDLIYECQYGINLEARVTSEPVEHEGYAGRKMWKWDAVNTQTGEVISYGITEGLSHYGPRLYRQPQYITTKNGEMRFPLLGEPT